MAQIVKPTTRGKTGTGRQYVYLMVCGDRLKIGRSNNPTRRSSAIQNGNPETVTIAHTWRVKGAAAASELERALHQHCAWARLRGEWFRVGIDVARPLGTFLINGEHERATALADVARRLASTEADYAKLNRFPPKPFTRKEERQIWYDRLDELGQLSIDLTLEANSLGREPNEWDEVFQNSGG